MFKTICKENNCLNKDITYYIPEISNNLICGGCKNSLDFKEMTKIEYEKIFDYDPFFDITTTYEK